MGPVTRFRLTSENRYVNGHWVVSGPYIGLGQFWIFDSPKKNEENRKNRKNREKNGRPTGRATAGRYYGQGWPGPHPYPFTGPTRS